MKKEPTDDFQQNRVGTASRISIEMSAFSIESSRKKRAIIIACTPELAWSRWLAPRLADLSPAAIWRISRTCRRLIGQQSTCHVVFETLAVGVTLECGGRECRHHVRDLRPKEISPQVRPCKSHCNGIACARPWRGWSPHLRLNWWILHLKCNFFIYNDECCMNLQPQHRFSRNTSSLFSRKLTQSSWTELVSSQMMTSSWWYPHLWALTCTYRRSEAWMAPGTRQSARCFRNQNHLLA